MHSFPEDFAAVWKTTPQVYTLNTSFRVPAEVLASAGALLGADPDLPTPASHAGKVDLCLFDQETTENDWIASEIKRLRLTKQLPYSEIAVLTRTSGQLPGLSRALDREHIPHARPGARADRPPRGAPGVGPGLGGEGGRSRSPEPPGMANRVRRPDRGRGAVGAPCSP